MQKILIVDDDPELRETVSILLEREQFVPIQAVDGDTGLEKALSVKPNLILVDLRLPGLSGIELCKQLRINRTDTPIIVLSAVGERNSSEIGVLLGRPPGTVRYQLSEARRRLARQLGVREAVEAG